MAGAYAMRESKLFHSISTRSISPLCKSEFSLNNFFPGLAILFAALAQFEQDGLFILISFFWLIFSVFYFALFFLGIYLLGSEGINYLPEWLADWT